MTQSSCKRDTKSKSHPSVKLAPVRVFSCKHPLRRDIGIDISQTPVAYNLCPLQTSVCITTNFLRHFQPVLFLRANFLGDRARSNIVICINHAPTQMFYPTEKSKIPSKFVKLAARYYEFGSKGVQL